MKKYAFNVKMASKNGAQAHMVIGAHPAADILALAEELNSKDFIVVEEFHHDRASGAWTQVGPVVLNQRVLGKVREYRERSGNYEA